MVNVQVKNLHYLNRYFKWIEIYKNRPIPDKGEYHHIIPKCIGGTDEKNNIIKLGYREHYISHYILAKAFDEKKLWFAFNCMRRVANYKSVLYEAARIEISKAISASNKGKVRDDNFRAMISNRFKGKFVAKNKNGETMLVDVNDPRVLSGEMVHHSTGRQHRKETLDKMKENGIRGKVAYHDSNGKVFYFSEYDETSGFTLGFPPDIIQKQIQNLRRKGRKLKLVTCPHCGNLGKGGNMTRYHFNNCKKRKNE